MKNKKLSLGLFALALAATFALPACGETAHTHTFSDEWSSDALGHWHAPTCGDTTQKKDLENHSFENGICTVCGYADPNYQDPNSPPVPDDPFGDFEFPEEDEIFDGKFTDVVSSEEREQVRKILEETLYRIGAGGGFYEGDILCRELNDLGEESSTVISGVVNDLRSGDHLKVKRMLHDPEKAIREPINLYATMELAFEEYNYATYVGKIPNAAFSLAKDTIDTIWETFSVALDFVEGDGTVRRKADGDISVIEVSAISQNTFDENYQFTMEQKQNYKFAFKNTKIIGLNATNRIEIQSSGPAQYGGGNSAMTVLVGDYSFEVPDTENCQSFELTPSWAEIEPNAGEEIFDLTLQPIENELQKKYWEDFLSAVRSNLGHGVRRTIPNTNFKLTQEIDGDRTEIIFDLYNGKNVRLLETYQDEQKTAEGENFDEIFYQFSEFFENDLMWIFTSYDSETNYEVTFYLNEGIYAFKIKDTISNRETMYLFDISSERLLAVKDIKFLEDGRERETTLLCGDFSVTT